MNKLIPLCLALLMGCDQAPAPNSKPRVAVPPQKITVAYTTQPQCTLIQVAVAKSYFSEEGLEVESILHTFGKASLQSLLDHKADFATVAETPFMFNVLKGEKIFIIANIEASGLNNAVVARRDADMAQPSDMKGKRIGFTPGTTSDFFLDSLLTANGLRREDIQTVPLKPEEMQEAIMANKVDAVSTWNYPLTQIFKQLGSNGILFSDPTIYTETYNVAAYQDYVHKNPETVKRFLRAIIKAEDFTRAHPAEAQAIMSTATKTDLDLVREVWSVFNYQAVLDKRLVITLEDESRWAMKHRLTEQTEMPDFRQFIHSDSLMAVKPQAFSGNR
ncbi:MAG: ABC transporter substrate-binding protein [Magnetococcales bacterium]|nr:ABC transporter substrate-binding protein [Magnetococcales bacterium]